MTLSPDAGVPIAAGVTWMEPSDSITVEIGGEPEDSLCTSVSFLPTDRVNGKLSGYVRYKKGVGYQLNIERTGKSNEGAYVEYRVYNINAPDN